MAKTHSLDTLVDDLAAYMEDTAGFLAEAMLEGGVAPFEARVTEQQRFEYFNRLLWNEDGTPNTEGRQHLIDQYGGDLTEYARVYRWTEARRNRGDLRGTTKKPARASAPVDEEEDY